MNKDVIQDVSKEGAGESADGSSFRLLLADDSAVERSTLAKILRQSGYEVNEAMDGKSAIDSLRHLKIDLLLLDLQMPSSDGFDVLTHLQKHRPDMKVILLSGLGLDEIQHSMHRLPTHELPPLLLKPIDMEQLLQVLDLSLHGELPR